MNRIPFDPAQLVPRPVVIRGVATFVSRVGDICLQEGRDGVMIEPPAGSERPAVGELMEATADLKFQSIDATDPDLILRASAVRRLGTAALPEPDRPWLVEALNGKSSRRWVEIEGVVMQAVLERTIT